MYFRKTHDTCIRVFKAKTSHVLCMGRAYDLGGGGVRAGV